MSIIIPINDGSPQQIDEMLMKTLLATLRHDMIISRSRVDFRMQQKLSKDENVLSCSRCDESLVRVGLWIHSGVLKESQNDLWRVS